MEFDWTTFALEIVNFLVLVWLLKRFFYKPVRGAIEARRQAVEKTLQAADAARTEAAAMKEQYETRLGTWQDEKRQAQEALRLEIAAERKRLLAGIEAETAQAREKSRLLAAREARERQAALTREALARGARFAAKLLAGVAGPDLDRQLIELLLKELQVGGDGLDLTRLRSAWHEARPAPTVATAHPLDDAVRESLVRSLEAALGKSPVPPEFAVDPALIAGAQVRLGSLAVGANLRDELRFFQETFRAE